MKGFKDFVWRGNAIDLAVAVVIAAAFTLVVGALLAGLINPLIAAISENRTWTMWAPSRSTTQSSALASS